MGEGVIALGIKNGLVSLKVDVRDVSIAELCILSSHLDLAKDEIKKAIKEKVKDGK